MFAAYPGDVVFSRIDARNGAIGVLQEGIAKAVVTSEFPVFVPAPDRLDGGFVKLVLRTGDFLAALRQKASGTSGRKRITPDAFADLHIPLPPLDEQRAIVAAHRAALARAADLKCEADAVEARAMEAFEAALGFDPPAPLPERPIFIASFKDLDRWSLEGILRRIAEGDTAHTSPYPIVRLRDVIADLVVGWSPRCLNRPAGENTAVPQRRRKVGPERSCDGMIESLQTNQITGGPGPWRTIIPYWRNFSSWCRDMNSRGMRDGITKVGSCAR